MTLSAGSRLGPYEILSPLGAGGMGEVYRAKDPRLGRDVAIKVLPASFSNDPDRLRRFEHEARAAGLLNHPNITSVYDIGSADGAPYVVTELLEGETLRSRLSGGALSARKALDYAIQVARGLAAAHEKGIVHRDLKPENLFVTKDGRVKILDFGLAKLKQPEDESQKTDLATATVGTEPGVVLGTMGYMSPEQVRGKPADYRSDLFAFGAILYEMLSGQRAFRGDTAADTMSAILTKEPPDLSATNRDVHPGVDRIVRHCLEKNPEERFHSAHDLAFDLEALSGISTTSAAAVPSTAPRRRRRALVALAAAAALAAVLAAGILVGKKLGFQPPPSFHQLTFRRGEISSARFAPDGQTILYAAAWDGKPVEVFLNRRERPESRSFGLNGADVLSISRKGEMAVSLDRHVSGPFMRSGTLAQMGVAGGGAPRQILEDVQWADWSSDSASLAIVREVGAHRQLEFPIGKVVYRTDGWISHPRVSPDGESIAFLDHPVLGDDGGNAAVIDRSGKKKTLSELFATLFGLAWSPNGDEVWFTAAPYGFNRGIYAVTLSGRQRLLSRVTGNLTLQDVSHDGVALVSHDVLRAGILGLAPGEEKERDLSWLDWSLLRSLSADGKVIFFAEAGEGGGDGYSVYVRGTDGSPAVRLGEGGPAALSPDAKWALAIRRPTTVGELVAYPTGTGEARPLPMDGLKVQEGDWTPDGKRIVVEATESGHGGRLYIRDFAGGKARAITPEGYRLFVNGISPDGKTVAVRGPDEKLYLYPLEGGEPTTLPGLTTLDRPVGWTNDGRLYVFRREAPARVYRYDPKTGQKELWKELMPRDAAGVSEIARAVPTPDGKAYAYIYIRTLSDLYLVEGLK
jgi:Tol biopolymer transport system component/predicted Ser/Thr protein kinase